MWYHRVIGGGRCPIVDTWWQTETGAIMIAPLPGATPTVPGSATRPLARHRPRDRHQGRQAGRPPTRAGFLVIKQPWPSMLRTLYGDDERYKAAVLERHPRLLLHRRRRPPRRERQLLDHGPRRRRAQRRRPPALDDGDRERPGQPPVGGRGRRRRQARRPEGSGASPPSSRSNRATRPARRCGKELRDHVVKEIGALARPDEIRFTDCPAQDPQRQDHAPAAPRHRRRRREHRRHHDARRPQRPGPAPPATSSSRPGTRNDADGAAAPRSGRAWPTSTGHRSDVI